MTTKSSRLWIGVALVALALLPAVSAKPFVPPGPDEGGSGSSNCTKQGGDEICAGTRDGVDRACAGTWENTDSDDGGYKQEYQMVCRGNPGDVALCSGHEEYPGATPRPPDDDQEPYTYSYTCVGFWNGTCTSWSEAGEKRYYPDGYVSSPPNGKPDPYYKPTQRSGGIGCPFQDEVEPEPVWPPAPPT